MEPLVLRVGPWFKTEKAAMRLDEAMQASVAKVPEQRSIVGLKGM